MAARLTVKDVIATVQTAGSKSGESESNFSLSETDSEVSLIVSSNSDIEVSNHEMDKEDVDLVLPAELI